MMSRHMISLSHIIIILAALSFHSCSKDNSEEPKKEEKEVILPQVVLPHVVIRTPNSAEIVSRTNWMEGASITITLPDGTKDYESNNLQIRGRGNTTWDYPKKPFALKLESKAEILGMPKHKRWVLLANWMDRTLMRNDVAFQIARQTELAWTPRGVFVELTLNGKHLGNYYLCEQIKIDKNRVNIREMSETDTEGDNLTGGYLMELDVYYDEVNKFHSSIKNLPYMFKDPDEETLQPEQYEYMKDFINEFEAKLYASDWLEKREYVNYINLESFVDYWFVFELSNNGEPTWPKSCYMYKDKSGKLTAGPVWDFDWGAFRPGNRFLNKEALYYDRLFKDPAFVSLVKTRWAKFRPKFDTIQAYIYSTAKKISASAQTNIALWPIDNDVNGDETLSFEQAIDRMAGAYLGKLAWMDKQINNM